MIFNYFIKTIKLILVVFCFLLLENCASKKTSEIEVIYESGKAIAITFTSSLASSDVKVYLRGNLDTPMLGDLSVSGNTYNFEPVIPFFEGNTYLVFQKDKEVSSFTISNHKKQIPPEVITIYPSTNSIPENLLKIYFLFSKPMQEVDAALDYITITNNETGKVVDVFLELNTELWNKDHTLLTLWLDPGRIKTDLIPNKEKGLPIIKGKHYTLKIDKNFKDANGTVLKQDYKKEFRVVNRDSKKPVPQEWELLATPDVLTLHFKEVMDAILAMETFHIENSKNENVMGDFELINEEKILKFHPKYPFALGTYTLVIESRLEDLAGNNLNHLFDNDLNISKKEEMTATKKLSFVIE